jgi:hypothetical protein
LQNPEERIALFHYYVTSKQSIDHGRSRGTEQQHKEKHNKFAFTKQRKGGITIYNAVNIEG